MAVRAARPSVALGGRSWRAGGGREDRLAQGAESVKCGPRYRVLGGACCVAARHGARS